METSELLIDKETALDGVRHNTIHNGIEVKFDAVPNYEDTSWLKRKGFRWSGRQKLWYVRYSEALFNEVKAKFDKELTPEEKEAAQQKAQQARENEAAEKENRIKNGFKDWAAREPIVYKYGSDVFSKFFNDKILSVTIRGITYSLNAKDEYEYLPKGRKRPDKYSIANIHYKMQDEVVKNGGYVSFENYFSNPQRRSSIPRYMLDDINRLLKHEWMQSAENEAYKNKIQEKVDAANVEAKKWADYRKRVFAPYASGFFRDEKEKRKPVYVKEKNGMWIPVYVGRLEDEITGSTRQDLINIEDRRGYIIFSSWKLIGEVYPENPAENPDAKSFLELFPMDGAAPVPGPQEPEQKPAPPANDKAFQFELELLELELDL